MQLHVSFVTRELQIQINEELLDSIFGSFGEVADITLKKYVRDGETLVQSGYGFIYYFQAEAAKAATAAIKKRLINGVTYDSSLSYRSEQVLQEGKLSNGSEAGSPHSASTVATNSVPVNSANISANYLAAPGRSMVQVGIPIMPPAGTQFANSAGALQYSPQSPTYSTPLYAFYAPPPHQQQQLPSNSTSPSAIVHAMPNIPSPPSTYHVPPQLSLPIQFPTHQQQPLPHAHHIQQQYYYAVPPPPPESFAQVQPPANVMQTLHSLQVQTNGAQAYFNQSFSMSTSPTAQYHHSFSSGDMNSLPRGVSLSSMSSDVSNTQQQVSMNFENRMQRSYSSGLPTPMAAPHPAHGVSSSKQGTQSYTPTNAPPHQQSKNSAKAKPL